jgi:hypothetical protein
VNKLIGILWAVLVVAFYATPVRATGAGTVFDLVGFWQTNAWPLSLSVVLASIVMYGMVKGCKYLWRQHKIRLERIDTLERAIRKNDIIYTRPDTQERVEECLDKLDSINKLIEEKCKETNCPIAHSMRNLHEDNRDTNTQIREIGEDLKKVTFELMALAKTLLEKSILETSVTEKRDARN